MTKEDYPIYAEDGTKFCMRHQGADGELVIEGPKGKRLTLTSFMSQIYNPSVANNRRGKITTKER